jgi:hypothetical protein
MRSRGENYLGVGFEIWTGQWTWFWSLVDPQLDGGAVGAASTEAEARREARMAIEEISARRGAGTACLRLAAGRSFDSAGVRQAYREVWTCRLNRVAEYLAKA